MTSTEKRIRKEVEECDEHNDQLLKWAATANRVQQRIPRQQLNKYLFQKPIRKQQAIIVNRFDGLLLSRRSTRLRATKMKMSFF